MLAVTLNCGSAGSNPGNTGNVSVASLLSEQQFNALFPMRNKFYSYHAFIKAVNELGRINLKVARRAASVYQFSRADKSTGKPVIIRQDEDWNEDWAKKKP